MRTVIVCLVLAVSAFAATSPVFQPLPVASACSCGDCNFIRDSAFVVRGTFLGWDYVRDAAGAPTERVVEELLWSQYQVHARPIELQLSVTAAFKGDVPSRIVISEALYDRYLRAEGSPRFAGWSWPGQSGICFRLPDDPTGEDVLLILQPASTPGQYRLVVGPRQYSDQAVNQFGRQDPWFGPPRPPSAGDSPVPESSEPAGDDWMFLSAIGAGFLLLSCVLILVGPRDDRRR